jgi:NitT/TauT family transport system substrate-binding protein
MRAAHHRRAARALMALTGGERVPNIGPNPLSMAAQPLQPLGITTSNLSNIGSGELGMRSRRLSLVGGLFLAFAMMAAGMASAAPLNIGYSDWPGWVAWQIAIDKGWLKEAGLDVNFTWFDYSASMDAYAAGKIDGNFVTNGDALVIGAGGARNVMILVTDYSNGNDMIVARAGIKSIQELKGRKIGVEMGLVDHLLLLDGLKKAGLSQNDVTLVNAKTNETPQVLASGQVDAIGAWQPNAGMAMRAVPGARPIYTSAQAPGLIYDVLIVSPPSLASHRGDYMKLIHLWARIVQYINDPKTQDDAVRIMAARVGLTPVQYKPLLAGTHLLDLAEAKTVFVKADSLASLYGSSKTVDDFNVRNNVYKQPQNIDSYIYPALTLAQP